MAKAAKGQQEADMTFSEASEALTGVVERFRSETLSLEEALQLFESGLGYVKLCQKTLQQSRGTLTELMDELAALDAEESGLAAEAETVCETGFGSAECPAGLRLAERLPCELTLAVADVTALAKALLTTFGLTPQGKVQAFARDDGSGVDVTLAFSNGWLALSWEQAAGALVACGQWGPMAAVEADAVTAWLRDRLAQMAG